MLLLEEIISQKKVIHIDTLATEKGLCIQVQTQLNYGGFLPFKGIDGIYGPQTKKAFHTFKKKSWLGKPDSLGPSTAKKLLTHVAEENIISKPEAEKIYGRKITEEQYQDLNECMELFDITTIERITHFLAQTAHESGGLKWLKELASGSAYEGRRDLGNTKPGYGRKYKGAGVIQLTGYYNYKLLQDYTNDPNVLAKGCNYVAKVYPFTSAGVWWSRNHMNSLCDKYTVGSEYGVKAVTKRVNGGYNGYADRLKYYKRAVATL